MADRLDEIRARWLEWPYNGLPQPNADVGWLLEHIEQLQQEIQRVTRANAEQQLRLSRERDRLRAQRQAVLDLCKHAVEMPGGSPASLILAALGADRPAGSQ